MQKAATVSLNALRVFLTVGQHMSIKHAAEELKVTPGAVSQQIKLLEETLAVKLFVRRNNAIDLTEAGSQLMRQSIPGLHTLHAAISNVARNANELCVRASMSLAIRWLIPRLDVFKRENPTALVQVETVFEIDKFSNAGSDVMIGYFQRDQLPTETEVLFEDICRPYLSPALLSKILNPSDLKGLPALQCAERNWDWELWLLESGQKGVKLDYKERFDLDDAALRAAVAGMGMVLTSAFMIEEELEDGRLCPLPNSQEHTLGYYTLHVSNRDTGLSRRFIHWLKSFD